MLTLKDLSADKELDREALTEVRGGSVNSTNVQNGVAFGEGGFLGYGEVTQNLLSHNSDDDIKLSQEYALLIGSPNGFAWT
jgi:hypothetical protein